MILATKITNFLFLISSLQRKLLIITSYICSYRKRMHEPANAIIGQLADIFLTLNTSAGILENAVCFVVWEAWIGLKRPLLWSPACCRSHPGPQGTPWRWHPSLPFKQPGLFELPVSLWVSSVRFPPKELPLPMGWCGHLNMVTEHFDTWCSKWWDICLSSASLNHLILPMSEYVDSRVIPDLFCKEINSVKYIKITKGWLQGGIKQ